MRPNGCLFQFIVVVCRRRRHRRGFTWFKCVWVCVLFDSAQWAKQWIVIVCYNSIDKRPHPNAKPKCPSRPFICLRTSNTNSFATYAAIIIFQRFCTYIIGGDRFLHTHTLHINQCTHTETQHTVLLSNTIVYWKL